MLFHALFCLAWDVVPHTPTTSIDIRRYTEPFLKESPVFLLGSLVARVGYGVAEIGDLFRRPGVKTIQQQTHPMPLP
jgi:hypothetical protein